MTFDNVLMFLLLSTNDDMNHNITLLGRVTAPLRAIYRDLGTEILFSIKNGNEYQVLIIERTNNWRENGSKNYFNKELTIIWQVLMVLVHKYSVKNPRTYYVEKYFDLSALVDRASYPC